MSAVVVSASTVGELRREVARLLGDASPTAALDARILVAHVVGGEPAHLALRDAETVSDETRARVMALARRRAAGEPVARIVGEKEFYGLTFALGPATLVPRPDTETVVDAVLESGPQDRPVTILDLGTGSGAILLALLCELPRARGVGLDLSEDAVRVARANASRLGVASRVSFAVGDWSAAIGARFDVVVANPPYIETGAIAGLPVDVRDHDPHVSLDGGPDGLAAFREILHDLGRVLSSNGAAFMEVGAGQAEAVAALANVNGFRTAFRRDLAGIERVAVVFRPEPSQALG